MRDYQRRDSKYILPRAVYHQTLWRIRDYYRLTEAADDLIESRNGDGSTRGSDVSDKVGQAVLKRERYMKEAGAIIKTLKEIPREYQKGVWDNIQYGSPYPMDAGRATYGRYKSMYVYRVAEKLGLI